MSAATGAPRPLHVGHPVSDTQWCPVDGCTEDGESRTHRVVLALCELCIDGVGGECQSPGCALWLNRAPDLSLRDVLELDTSMRATSWAMDDGNGRNTMGRITSEWMPKDQSVAVLDVLTALSTVPLVTCDDHLCGPRPHQHFGDRVVYLDGQS